MRANETDCHQNRVDTSFKAAFRVLVSEIEKGGYTATSKPQPFFWLLVFGAKRIGINVVGSLNSKSNELLVESNELLAHSCEAKPHPDRATTILVQRLCKAEPSNRQQMQQSLALGVVEILA